MSEATVFTLSQVHVVQCTPVLLQISVHWLRNEDCPVTSRESGLSGEGCHCFLYDARAGWAGRCGRGHCLPCSGWQWLWFQIGTAYILAGRCKFAFPFVAYVLRSAPPVMPITWVSYAMLCENIWLLGTLHRRDAWRNFNWHWLVTSLLLLPLHSQIFNYNPVCSWHGKVKIICPQQFHIYL